MPQRTLALLAHAALALDATLALCVLLARTARTKAAPRKEAG